MGDLRGLGRKGATPNRMELSPQQIGQASCFNCSFYLAEHLEVAALPTPEANYPQAEGGA